MENELTPNWQFNVLPGNANQGAILITISELLNPPFNASNFQWVNMEDIIGVANVKLEYDESENIYKLYKAKGHRLNNDEWIYDWIEIGAWETLTEETAELLRSIVYIRYDFIFVNQNNLRIYGTRKDGTQNLLCDLHFATYMNLQNEIDRATNRENQIENGLAIEAERAADEEERIETKIDNEIDRATTEERFLNYKIEEEEERAEEQENILRNKINNMLDDSIISNEKGWSSEKISQEMTSALHYKGQVATVGELPEAAQVGDVYNVEATGDNYCYNGSGWDKLSGEYIGGQGITIDGKTIRARGANSQGIEVNANGIKTKIDNNTIKYNSIGQMYVDAEKVIGFTAGDALEMTLDNQLNVQVDNTTIGVDAYNRLQNLYRVNGGVGTEIDINEKVNIKYNNANLKINSNNELDTKLQIWNGTQAEYDAIIEKDPNTLYLINEEA